MNNSCKLDGKVSDNCTKADNATLEGFCRSEYYIVYWEQTPVNNYFTTKCPFTDHPISRNCTSTGWYPQSNKHLFDVCEQAKESSWKKEIATTTIGYSLTIAVCSFAFIFICCSSKMRKQFHNIIHASLYFCFVIYGLILLVADFVLKNKDLSVAEHFFLRLIYTYFTVARFIWLFAEGLYIYVCLSRPFNMNFKIQRILMIQGWCIPFILSLLYCLMEIMFGGQHVWRSKSNAPSYLTLILECPIVIIYIVTICFSCCVLRITWLKLRKLNTMSHSYRPSNKDSDRNKTIESMDVNESNLDYSGVHQLKIGATVSTITRQFIRRQRRDCQRWARMARSSLVVGIMMGFHFLPTMLPYVYLLDRHSSAMRAFLMINSALQSFNGVLVGGVSFALKPEVSRVCRGYKKRFPQLMLPTTRFFPQRQNYTNNETVTMYINQSKG